MKALKHMLAVVLGLAMVLATAASTRAQDATDQIVTRTYDVSDFIRANADYALDGDLIGVQVTPAAVSLDALTQLLQDTVATDTWRNNGGQIGVVRSLGSVLIVTQSTSIHDQIADFLRQLRSTNSPTTVLTVRTYWLKLDPQEVAAIFAARKPAPEGGISEMPVVPDNLLDKAHLYFMGQTMCFNTQTVSITSGRDWQYVSDLTPVVGTNAVAVDPQVALARNGVRLQLTPQVIPDGSSVVLDLHNTISEATPAGQIPLQIAATTQPGASITGAGIERINSVAQNFATTVRIPLSKRILIGGMTLEPAQGDNPARQLFLAVEVDAVR